MSGNEHEVQEKAVKKDDLPELQSVLENIAKEEGYITYEIATTKIDSGGANYSGVLFEVDIKGQTKDGEKKTNLFLKKAINDGLLGELVGVSNIYATEYYVYKDLAKRFHELQVKANVPEEEMYKMVKCYESSEPSMIILENLVKKSFGTPHRMDVVSLKYAEMCMEQLAKFHALSFALELKDPEYFDNKLRHLRYPLGDDENARSLYDMSMKMAVRELDPINKEKGEKIIAVFSEKYGKYMRPESSSITCLCHGDFRGSNVLMRKNEGEITEVIPIDYQCIHIGCPLNDFMFFICCSTDRKFRVQHLENLKTLYHDTLTKFLKYFEIDSNDVFPRKEMDEIFKQRKDYVALLAVFGFPFIFAAENALEVNDLSEAKAVLDERYKERLIEVLEDFPLQEFV